MIKNNKIKTCIVGACIIANTLTMTAFADTNNNTVRTLPAIDNGSKAIVQQTMAPDTTVSSDHGKVYKTMELQTAPNDKVLEKQLEIDRYLFADHVDEIAQKGFTVTHTAPMGDKVEIGIKPYNQANADYLYGLFGKEMVNVVAGEQAELMQVSLAATDNIADAQVVSAQVAPKSESKIASFFNNIIEWFKNIF